MLDSTSGVTPLPLRSSDVNDGTAVPAAYGNECQCSPAVGVLFQRERQVTI